MDITLHTRPVHYKIVIWSDRLFDDCATTISTRRQQRGDEEREISGCALATAGEHDDEHVVLPALDAND